MISARRVIFLFSFFFYNDFTPGCWKMRADMAVHLHPTCAPRSRISTCATLIRVTISNHIPTPPCRGTSIDSRRGFAVEADRRFFGSKCVMGRLIARSAKKATRRSTQSPNMPRPNAPLFFLPAFASESLLSPRSRLPAFVGRAGTTLCETIASLRTA